MFIEVTLNNLAKYSATQHHAGCVQQLSSLWIPNFTWPDQSSLGLRLNETSCVILHDAERDLLVIDKFLVSFHIKLWSSFVGMLQAATQTVHRVAEAWSTCVFGGTELGVDGWWSISRCRFLVCSWKCDGNGDAVSYWQSGQVRGQELDVCCRKCQ